MKSVLRDVRNKFFYEGAENLVRDATSNNNELPSPLQLKKIGEACGYPDSYTLIFAQLHKRLTHLEYKRHVVKSLLVLDHLIRLKPPSATIQLKLIVDVREHWNDVYRLARLRVQSSSATIQQIQRVAERLCEFIWRFEQGEIAPGDENDDGASSTAKKPKKVLHPAEKPKRRKKRAESDSSSSSSSSSSSDSDDGVEGAKRPRKRQPSGGPDLLSPSRIPNFKNLSLNNSGSSHPAPAPAMSPFGFDFGFWGDGAGQHTAPRPKMSPQQGQQNGKNAILQPQDPFGSREQSFTPNWAQAPPVENMPGLEAVDWVCSACTYHNPSDQNACIMCATPRGGRNPGWKSGVTPPPPLAISSPQSTNRAGGGDTNGWACQFCSFLNAASATVCHVCDHLRSATMDADFHRKELELQRGMNTNGSYDDEAEEKKDSMPAPMIVSPPRTLGRPGGISCSWCQYLNPPTAIKCEICEKDLTASANAQRMKLQMAQQQQLKKAAAAQQANLSWQCVNCTHINAPGALSCVRCQFNPSAGLLPHQSASSVYAAALGPPIAGEQLKVPGMLSKQASNTAQAFNNAGIGSQKAGAQPAAGAKATAASSSRTGSISAPGQSLHSASTSVPSSGSSSPAPGDRRGSASASSSVGAEYMPEHDLLDLLLEQNEDELSLAPGGHPNAQQQGGDRPAHQREKSVIQQVQALSVYNEVAEELKAGKWQCVHCSYLNFPQDKVCEMCQLVRPSPGNPFATAETNLAGQQGETNFQQQTAGQTQQQTKPQRIQRSQTMRPPSSSGTQQASQQQQQQRQPQQQAVPRSNLQPAPGATGINALNPFDVLQPLSNEQKQSLGTQPISKSNSASQLNNMQQPQPQKGTATTPQQQRPPQHHTPTPSTSIASPEKEWACQVCTFVNPGRKVVCGMCDQARAPIAAPPASKSQTLPQPQSAPAPRSRDASPTGRRTPVSADPYSSLLAAGLSHSTSPHPYASKPTERSLPAPSHNAAPASSPALSLALAPPNQPSRHRAGSKGERGSAEAPLSQLQQQPQQQQQSGVSATAAGKKLTQSGTLPPNFRPSDHHAPPTSSSSFQSFEPRFPEADAFSHLHAGTGPKSPPGLDHPGQANQAEVAKHERELSFQSMFNSNADLFAKKVVGHLPGTRSTGASPSHSPANSFGGHGNDFELRVDAGLEVVGEDDQADGAEEKKPRTKEEKEAHKKEKAERRARREAKRLAKAQAMVDEENKRLAELAAKQAESQQKSLYQEVLPARALPSVALPVAKPVLPDPVHVPAIPPRPTNKPHLTPSPPPPVPPMPVLSPGTVAAISGAPAAGAKSPSPPGISSPVGASVSPQPSGSPTRVPMDQAALRQKVVDEIKSTERLYVEALFDLINNFQEPMKKLASKLGITTKQIALIFSNLNVLAQFHTLFLTDLNKPDCNVIEVFKTYADFLKMYSFYCSSYEKSIATINSLRTNTKFQRFLEEKRDLLKGRGLMFFLIMPVQRIPRYVLLLRELKRHTPGDSPELEPLNFALAKIESIASHVNESKRHVENMSKLLDIQNRLQDNKFVLFKPDRRLLREGMLKRLKEDYVLSDSSNRPAAEHEMVDQLFFLFNDLLLWTTPTFDITGSVELSKLSCLPNQVASMQNTLSLQVRGKPYSADMVFLCKDAEEHDQWLRFLDAAIHTANELVANPGVRMIQGNHARSGSSVLSPSPAPSHASPPSANSHPLSGASSAENYDAQQKHAQRAVNAHELEI